jgi:hypothetical protein
MPFVMVKVEVQDAVPGGTITVSPSLAESTADLTSVNKTLLALTTAASTWPTALNNVTAVITATLRVNENFIFFGTAIGTKYSRGQNCNHNLPHQLERGRSRLAAPPPEASAETDNSEQPIAWAQL